MLQVRKCSPPFLPSFLKESRALLPGNFTSFRCDELERDTTTPKNLSSTFSKYINQSKRRVLFRAPALFCQWNCGDWTCSPCLSGSAASARRHCVGKEETEIDTTEILLLKFWQIISFVFWPMQQVLTWIFDDHSPSTLLQIRLVCIKCDKPILFHLIQGHFRSLPLSCFTSSRCPTPTWRRTHQRF